MCVCSCSELVAVESSCSHTADVKASTYPAELSDSVSLLDICESNSNRHCTGPSSDTSSVLEEKEGDCYKTAVKIPTESSDLPVYSWPSVQIPDKIPAIATA